MRRAAVDTVMPSSRYRVRVLFTSGDARDSIAHHGRLDEGARFPGKPFTSVVLARKDRSLLDQGR